MNINQLSEILKKKILIHKILKKVEVEQALAGDIVALYGIDGV